MEKGNKVLIKDTGSVWDGKRGTVISEEDGQVEVRINFETEDGTKQVIEIFDKENLEMEREDESLNEAADLDFEDETDDDEIDYDEVYEEIKNTETFNEMTVTSKTPEGEEFQVNVLYHDSPEETREWIEEMLEQYPYYFDDNEIIADPWNDNANGYFFIDGQRASYIYGELVIDGEPIHESLNESLNYEKTDDIIHQYVYLQDLDDKEIPAWNFASRIATAENVEEGFVLKCAEDHKYKIFSVEAPSFFRTIIAAKEIKLEDIQEEYADFLQGNAVIYEMK